jgi:A/G-specific adenine glycosylase
MPAKPPAEIGHSVRFAFNAERVATIQQSLLAWYAVHKRRLPWRGDAPPFSGSGSKASVSKRRAEAAKTDSLASKGQPTLSALFKSKHQPKPDPESADAGPDTEAVTDLTSDADIVPPVPTSPYATWVSEIMLQQTRVEAVIDHFLRWMVRFPTVARLAAASEDEVVAQWAGLGYYRRAKLLLKGAIHVMVHHGGLVPSTVAELLKVPGIGEYTAGAIASIAFGVSAPLVDGNVIRLVSRLAAHPGAANDTYLKQFAWEVASTLVPKPDREASDGEVFSSLPGDFNQSMMELGATICTPAAPDCGNCPLRLTCRAHLLEKAGAKWKSVSKSWAFLPDIEDAAAGAAAAASSSSSSSSASASSTSASGGAVPGIGPHHPLDKATPVHPAQFPAKAIKASSRVEKVDVYVRFSISRFGWPRVWMKQRPDHGLLAGQTDFPMTITLTSPPKRARAASAKKPKAAAAAAAAGDDDDDYTEAEERSGKTGRGGSSTDAAAAAKAATAAAATEAATTAAADAATEQPSPATEAATAAYPASTWTCSEYKYVFSGAKQMVTVHGSVEPDGGKDTEDGFWAIFADLPQLGLTSFACKAVATAMEHPLRQRLSVNKSYIQTAGKSLAKHDADAVTMLLARSKLANLARREGWWEKR